MHIYFYHFALEIETSIVDTFLGLSPSVLLKRSEPSFTLSIRYPRESILFTIICATSTARVMLFPLALMITVGSLLIGQA